MSILAAKLAALAEGAALRRELRQMCSALESKARQILALRRDDPLMGRWNAAYFRESLAREFKRAIRCRAFVTILLIEVDAFLRHYDYYGRVAGARCLKAITDRLKTGLKRPTDIFARDEEGARLIACLPSTPEVGAQVVGEGMCRMARRMRIDHRVSDADDIVTISVGCAALRPEAFRAPVSLIESTEQALANAKAKGKNRLVCAGDLSVVDTRLRGFA